MVAGLLPLPTRCYRARKDTADNWAVDMADGWNGSKIVPDMGSLGDTNPRPGKKSLVRTCIEWRW